jgi:hypothetical protein
MDALNLDEPDENYWYAFGRIAEQYGEHDAAIANYARVTKPKNGSPNSRLDLLLSTSPLTSIAP